MDSESKKKKLVTARKTGSIFCFIDNLTAFHNGGEFGKSLQETYPPKLGLKMETASTYKASFFDLNIKIPDKDFTLGLYNKRDRFLFSIFRISFMFLLKYFITHLELKFFELAVPRLTPITLNHHVKLFFRAIYQEDKLKSIERRLYKVHWRNLTFL